SRRADAAARAAGHARDNDLRASAGRAAAVAGGAGKSVCRVRAIASNALLPLPPQTLIPVARRTPLAREEDAIPTRALDQQAAPALDERLVSTSTAAALSRCEEPDRDER